MAHGPGELDHRPVGRGRVERSVVLEVRRRQLDGGIDVHVLLEVLVQRCRHALLGRRRQDVHQPWVVRKVVVEDVPQDLWARQSALSKIRNGRRQSPSHQLVGVATLRTHHIASSRSRTS
jgi:hypothetical protein